MLHFGKKEMYYNYNQSSYTRPQEGQDDEITRVWKRSAAREQGKPEATGKGNKGSSGMKRVENWDHVVQEYGQRKEQVVWSMVIKGPALPSSGH